jgi:multidrug efflux pump subunit AcrA (membrane-fusion protein)
MGERKFPAKLYSRGPSAAEPLRAIPLEVELTGPGKGTALVPGTTGVLRVKVPRGKSSGHPVIPAAAVVGDGKGGGEVWVIEPGKKQARKKPVKLGTLRDGMIEITSGLEAGERVITAGQGALTPGCPVRVAAAPAASG